MKFSEKIVNKWKDVGILEGIPDEHHEIVIETCENLVDYILNKYKNFDFPEHLDSWAFPMLRRILVKTDYQEVHIAQLILFSTELISGDEFQSMKNGLNVFRGIDAESYFIDYTTDKYIEKYYGGNM